jgi:hypothetical protein
MPRGGVTFLSTFRFIFRSGFRFTFRLERNTQYRPNSLQMRTIGQAQQRPTKGALLSCQRHACQRVGGSGRHGRCVWGSRLPLVRSGLAICPRM